MTGEQLPYLPSLDPGWKRTRVAGLGWRGGGFAEAPGFGDMQVSDHGGGGTAEWVPRGSLFFFLSEYGDIGRWWIGEGS